MRGVLSDVHRTNWIFIRQTPVFGYIERAISEDCGFSVDSDRIRVGYS